MEASKIDLPIQAFESAIQLRSWLSTNHSTSHGLWVRVFKRGAGVASVTFDELLDEGLCFGWSESMRRKCDSGSYLQKFTPRKTVGTQSERNQARIRSLVQEGRMTPAGLKVLRDQSR
jgi:uncharacterized protein YdeI (YjbR/CyaY-like superfamily)